MIEKSRLLCPLILVDSGRKKKVSKERMYEYLRRIRGEGHPRDNSEGNVRLPVLVHFLDVSRRAFLFHGCRPQGEVGESDPWFHLLDWDDIHRMAPGMSMGPQQGVAQAEAGVGKDRQQKWMWVPWSLLEVP